MDGWVLMFIAVIYCMPYSNIIRKRSVAAQVSCLLEIEKVLSYSLVHQTCMEPHKKAMFY